MNFNAGTALGNGRDSFFNLTGASENHLNEGTLNVSGGVAANTGRVNVSGSSSLFRNQGTVTIGSDGGFVATGNEYRQVSGTTTVGTVAGTNVFLSAGQLNVNGGKLEGHGTLTGPITLNIGGSIAPGSSTTNIGTLANTGSLTWNSDDVTSGMSFNLSGASTSDLLTLSTGFNKSTGLLYQFEFNGGGMSGGNYTLLNFGSTTFTSGSQFEAMDLASGSSGTFLLTGNSTTPGSLVLQVVPEPTTFAMLLGGLGMLILARRRRR